MLYRLIKRLSVYNFACALTKRAQRSFFSPRPPRNLCNLRGSSLAAKSTRPEHSHVLQLSRHLQEKQHRPSVVVEIGDGQHLIHTCQRFQRTTAAIYQQRANLKRWGWWGGYDMIGATSPCTMYFSSANNYKDVDIKLNSQRKAFEGIVPLHQRNWDFQKY